MELPVKNVFIPDHVVRIWQQVVDAVADIIMAPSVMINRLQPPELEVFRANVGPQNPFPSGTRMPLSGVYCESAARRREMVKVEDARKDPVWADSPTAKAGIYAYLGYPVFWPDGDVFGTLCAVDTRENHWLGTHEQLMLTLKNAVEAHLTMLQTTEALNAKNRALEQARGEVRTLRGMLPICSSCKKIRDDKGYWNRIEEYIEDHTEVEFSHGICPECRAKLYPDLCSK